MQVKSVDRIASSVTLGSVLMVGLILAQLLVTFSANAQGKQSKKTKTTTSQTSLVTVRGRVDRKGDSKSYPAAFVKVTIVPYVSKNDKKAATLAYTGSDGLYYFHVRPANYLLQVWVSETESKRFIITVANQKYVDVAPIVIP